jgi:uncharacterized coiled-coil protein SlyX
MIKPQNKIIAHATTAQQAKELKALTATLKEQASQIQKVSDRLEHLKPTKKDLMISKIISGAACLAELTSNPKSFYNCPDLHGGVPDLPGDKICMKPVPGKKKVVRWHSQCVESVRKEKLWAAA